MSIPILIVDDEVRIRQAVSALLTQAGFQVDTADNSRDAFRMATTNEYEVIVMDLNMPGINGLEGIRSIRLIKAEQKVIVLTGYSTDEIKEQAIEAGAYSCLFKPGGIRELTGEINSLVGREDEAAN